VTSLDEIADAVASITTSRVATDQAIMRTDYRKLVVHDEGIRDYRRHIGMYRTTIKDVYTDRMEVGPDVLRRLSAIEREETGYFWRWESKTHNWRTEHAETVASLRATATIIRSSAELLDGQEVRHHTLRVKPRRGVEDPLLITVNNIFHDHGHPRLTYEVWLTADGTLLQTRERWKMRRSHARPGQVAYTVKDSWDFGVSTAHLRPPPPATILPRDDDEPAPQPGLTVLIDGAESAY
jgi:hypothetical protein